MTFGLIQTMVSTLWILTKHLWFSLTFVSVSCLRTLSYCSAWIKKPFTHKVNKQFFFAMIKLILRSPAAEQFLACLSYRLWIVSSIFAENFSKLTKSKYWICLAYIYNSYLYNAVTLACNRILSIIQCNKFTPVEAPFLVCLI